MRQKVRNNMSSFVPVAVNAVLFFAVCVVLCTASLDGRTQVALIGVLVLLVVLAGARYIKISVPGRLDLEINQKGDAPDESRGASN